MLSKRKLTGRKRIPSFSDGGKKRKQDDAHDRGELEAYWEQGWEGRIEFAFHYEGLKRLFSLKMDKT